MPSRNALASLASVLIAAACAAGAAGAQPSAAPAAASGAKPLRLPDVPYEPSRPEVVKAMLRLGGVTANDVVFDLGCGDGRIVIAAARDLGARGVCVDIDPERIAEARANAATAGVADRIEFRTEDLFHSDISTATAVMLFLWPSVNLALRPRLQRELQPGARVVSHYHDMGNWKPQQALRFKAGDRERMIYLWRIPPR